MRCAAILILACLAVPAAAQQRVVVVPAEGGVAIPARGAVAPPMVSATRPRLGQRRGGPPRAVPGGGTALSGVTPLAGPALIGLPLAAAAAAFIANGSGTTPGRGSGTSAPARTR